MPTPSGPRSGSTGTTYSWRPCTKAVVQAPWTCQRRILTRPPPARARAGRRRPGRRATPTSPRHGWPSTGQTRARQPAQGTSTKSSSCGTRHGRQRTGGTVGAKSETTGVPTAAARCAGPVLPTTTQRAAARTSASAGNGVRPPRSVTCGPRRAGDERRERLLPRAAGHHDAAPARDERVDQRRAAVGRPRARGDGGAGVHDDVVAAGPLGRRGVAERPQHAQARRRRRAGGRSRRRRRGRARARPRARRRRCGGGRRAASRGSRPTSRRCGARRPGAAGAPWAAGSGGRSRRSRRGRAAGPRSRR